MSSKDAVWGITKAADRSVSGFRQAEGKPDRRLLAIPPKYAVLQVVGYIKGKSAIHLARVYGERKRNFVGRHFWARVYFVSTVGWDEAIIREYIRN